jgi:hypothetical protein
MITRLVDDEERESATYGLSGEDRALRDLLHDEGVVFLSN